jgi:hypothetical protein
VTPLVARNANIAEVTPVVQTGGVRGGRLELGGWFCVGAFCSRREVVTFNLVHECCTFSAICKYSDAINSYFLT